MALAEPSTGWLAARRSVAVPTTSGLPSPRVVFALARIEARKVLVHPIYLVVALLGTVAVGGQGFRNFTLRDLLPLLFSSIVGLFVGTLVTSNLAAIRSHRDDTDELFGAMPTPAVARTASQLVGVAMGPGAFALAWSTAALAFRLVDPTSALIRDVEPIMLPQFPLAIVAIGALGISVGRWVPTVFGGAILVALHIFTGIIWAVPWIIFSDHTASNAWHLGYLVAITTSFAAAAFFRDRRRPITAVIAAAGLAVAILTATQQVPPGGY